MPTETRGVLSVSALGPSLKKADYSNWALHEADFSAPGGYFRDFIGTDQYMRPENLILSPMPLNVAQAEGVLNPGGTPTTPFVVRDCRGSDCAYFQYLQGTSMASPHAAGWPRWSSAPLATATRTTAGSPWTRRRSSGS